TVADKSAFEGNEPVAAAIRSAQSSLGDGGRVLVRPSGTENLIRVMVEAETHERAADIAGEIAGVVAAELG
ncbi:MAG: phosphoglucosamine mutase, partial [Actinobacteria bacterium]